MIVKSYAKVNCFLEVIKKRKDSYHQIKTLFERIDLCDTLVLTPLAGTRIRILSDSPALPLDSSNLAYRSAHLLQQSCNIKQGIQIDIRKRIPIGSGLAGGSSNAAAVLRALNSLWKLDLTQKELVRLAAKVGSDVAFFVYNTPFAIGEGRGELISPVRSLRDVRRWHVVAVPRLHVSTPLIYRKWDMLREKGAVRLTRPAFDVTLLILALKQKDANMLGKNLFNSLEPVTCALYPQVERVREAFLKKGVQSILMSGSGPAVFGIVSSRKEALKVCRQFAHEHKDWQVFATKTA